MQLPVDPASPTETPAVVDATAAPPSPAPAARGMRRETLVWLLMSSGFALFLAFGWVTVRAGPRQGGRVRLLAEWRDFLASLPTVGQPVLLQVLVAGALVMIVVAVVWALRLALLVDETVGPITAAASVNRDARVLDQ